MRSFFAWVGGGLVVAALVTGVVVGGWQLGWWMTSAATNRQAHIYQHSYGAQAAYVQQLSQAQRDVAAVDVQLHDPHTPASELTALRAQRAAIVGQACDTYARVTAPLPDYLASFAAANCGGQSNP
jgi:hypothetical protein